MFLLYSLVDAVSSLLVLDSSTLLLLVGVWCMVYGVWCAVDRLAHLTRCISVASRINFYTGKHVNWLGNAYYTGMTMMMDLVILPGALSPLEPKPFNPHLTSITLDS
jgi:hypothetical protein